MSAVLSRGPKSSSQPEEVQRVMGGRCAGGPWPHRCGATVSYPGSDGAEGGKASMQSQRYDGHVFLGSRPTFNTSHNDKRRGVGPGKGTGVRGLEHLLSWCVLPAVGAVVLFSRIALSPSHPPCLSPSLPPYMYVLFALLLVRVLITAAHRSWSCFCAASRRSTWPSGSGALATSGPTVGRERTTPSSRCVLAWDGMRWDGTR